MIQFGNRLVREGLVIPENLTATDKQIDQRSDSGRAFLGLRGITDIPGTLVANDPDVKLIPVDMVRAKYGADPVLTKKRHRVDRYS
jgi:hypothetical protein